VASEYDQRYGRPLDLAEDEVLYRLVAERDPNVVLDLGCGTGRLLDFVNPLTYVGVDVSRAMLEQAKAKMRSFGQNRRFVEASAESAWEIVAAGAFDVACTFWAFSYFQDPDAVLRSMHTALRRGGLAVVHAYAPRYSKRPNYILNETVFETQSVDELKLMMLGAGFHTVRASAFRVLPDWALAPLSTPAIARYLEWEMRSLPPEWGMTHVLTGVK
jgi:SAM-dependent methyltransferase